jgi:hypothetical protein
MSCIALAPRTIVRTNVALRGLQFLSSLAALALISASFQETFYSPLLGSRSGQFLMLTTYSSMVYAGWFLACVELYPLATRPRILMMRALDFVNVIALVLAALIMLNSDFASECGTWNGLVRCRNLNSSLLFAVVSALLFAASIALTYVKKAAETETMGETTDYTFETTPTNAVYSPQAAVNAPPTPSAKV